MLVIGFRVQHEGNGKEKIWFLIQNSWASMPLVKVSAAYLSHHVEKKAGGYSFIEQPLQAFPKGTQATTGLVQNSYFLDGGDDEIPEPTGLERGW
jgi:hypothetical protein